MSELHFRVVDKGGLFLPVALRLAREASVSYWSPHERDFDSVCDQVGVGFGVERVESPVTDKESVDYFVFPDVGMIDEQLDLRDQGFKVFGSGRGGLLEIDRGLFLDTLAEIGLEVPPHERLRGIARLREYLKNKEDLYVKISRYRRDVETFHWRSWPEDKDLLAEKEVRLGPFGEQVEFFVCESIEAVTEDGLDTFFAGDYPELVLHGVEAKDKALLATWQPWDQVPDQLRRVNEAMAAVLAEHDYRGPFSTEVRLTEDGRSYFTDPTCRFGSPPHQCQSELIENYAEVIRDVAEGKTPYLVPAHRFGVQVVINTGRCGDSWTYVKLDPELRQWVKPSRAMFFGGMVCGPPDPHFTNCEDWLVGVGDSIEDCIHHLRENIQLLPAGVTCDISSISELIKEIQEGEERGIEFTDQPVPEPEIVLEES